MGFNEWLQAKGFALESLTEAQKVTLQAAWRAEQNPPSAPAPQPGNDPAKPPSSSFDEKMAAYEAEAARIKYIEDRTEAMAAQCVGSPDRLKQLREICASAILDKKTDARAYDLAMLRFDRFAGPLVYSPSQPEINESVVEAAVCRTGGLKTLEKEFDEKTLSAVDKKFRGGIGLCELIGIGARQNGWRGSDVKRDPWNALKASFNAPRDDGYGPRALGPSTISVSGILSNTANKFLREGWMFVESGWRTITAIRSVSDFKTITSYSMTGDNQYKQLPPGGQIEHGTLGNETYTNRADTYARILGIDRRDIINDDLGAFTRVGSRLGRGGALKVNDVFWTEFMADASTFYTAARLNYDDGTDTAFSNDGLVAADIIWQSKTDPDGKPLGASAKYLVVPPAHKIPAWRLMNSQRFDVDSEEGELNPWAGKFEVVTSTYLANSNYTGYSAVAWYMLADPNDLPVIETCFLNGNEMPTVETVELDSDRLGVAMRAFHDFGCNKQEYRGGLKLKGEA